MMINYSLPINNKAASITAAPFNMVAIRISWPGQSTKEMCLCNSKVASQFGFSHFGLSSLSDPNAL